MRAGASETSALGCGLKKIKKGHEGPNNLNNRRRKRAHPGADEDDEDDGAFKQKYL